jgi:hypothetical protein
METPTLREQLEEALWDLIGDRGSGAVFFEAKDPGNYCVQVFTSFVCQLPVNLDDCLQNLNELKEMLAEYIEDHAAEEPGMRGKWLKWLVEGDSTEKE